jgi:hypothetical protein
VRQGRFGLERNARAPAAEHEILLEHQAEHRNRRTVGRHWQGDGLLRRGIEVGEQRALVDFAADQLPGLCDELLARQRSDRAGRRKLQKEID